LIKRRKKEKKTIFAKSIMFNGPFGSTYCCDLRADDEKALFADPHFSMRRIRLFAHP
jgi:hypothetical protein